MGMLLAHPFLAALALLQRGRRCCGLRAMLVALARFWAQAQFPQQVEDLLCFMAQRGRAGGAGAITVRYELKAAGGMGGAGEQGIISVSHGLLCADTRRRVSPGCCRFGAEAYGKVPLSTRSARRIARQRQRPQISQTMAFMTRS